ncbi:hypothetical protein BP5796_03381 [Coleophoma crateriformis]|uniref:Uncharacterized protein n=1 Tax=Coleophoma crateriformis TaxID=565419 RepID=A0A3D8SMZ5_9HELO|nr:hypothetical protein BP5796_03381 [Coleophoma crateriformis]
MIAAARRDAAAADLSNICTFESHTKLTPLSHSSRGRPARLHAQPSDHHAVRQSVLERSDALDPEGRDVRPVLRQRARGAQAERAVRVRDGRDGQCGGDAQHAAGGAGAAGGNGAGAGRRPVVLPRRELDACAPRGERLCGGAPRAGVEADARGRGRHRGLGALDGEAVLRRGPRGGGAGGVRA